MNRRGFLQAILAAGVAPYVVTTAGLLMPVRKIVTAPAFTFTRDSVAYLEDFEGKWFQVERGSVRNVMIWNRSLSDSLLWRVTE